MIAYVALLATLYTEPKEALHVEYAVSVAALVVCSCWLTIALVSVEDPVQRLITLSHARSWSPIVAGLVLTVLLASGGLTILSLAWSLLVHRTPPGPSAVLTPPAQHGGSASELVLGAVSHLSAVITGIAIGLPCSRLLVGRLGWTLLAGLTGCLLVLLVRWIPVVNPLLRALSRTARPGTDPALLSLGISLLLLAISGCTVGLLARRRS